MMKESLTILNRVLGCCLLIQMLIVGVAAQTDGPTSGEKDGTTSQLLGISIGSSLEEARSKLSQLGTGGGRDTREGGRKEAWTLKDGDFATLAFKTNRSGKIVWISAFARPGKQIAFAKLGNLTKATNATQSEAIWNVETPQGGYRLVAKGTGGKANVIYLLSLDFPEIQ